MVDCIFIITAAFTDIGLPAGQTRDGTWNVNNWTERAFLAFDTIFLDNRRNKRYVHLFWGSALWSDIHAVLIA